MGCQRKIELLQAEADDNDESYFRVLVDGRSIKYITIETGIFSVEDMCFGPSFASILPELPSGEWNDGLVARNPDSGRPYFAYVCQTAFSSVKSTWHEVYIDYFDLSIGKRLRSGVYEVDYPLFNEPVVAKFARFEWEVGYMENETTAYQWIDGHNIGPKFLGHLTEHGRVFGFLMERVRATRHAGLEDLESCQKVLARLHGLGILHGDTNRFNFLVEGPNAVLIDFYTARKCDDLDLLREEFENLGACLESSSNRGGGGVLCMS